MEYFANGLTLSVSEDCFPLSTDSMLLAHFAKLPKNATVLDLGAGCGTLGILLCAKDPTCRVTGVELSPQAHESALDNIQRNQLQERMVSICADLRHAELMPSSFSLCVSNPPYFSGGPASKEHPLARREDCCTPAELFATAASAIKYGGDFCLVHKPERLAELIACGARVGLEAKRLMLVRHRECGAFALVLLQFRKGGKPGLILEEATLFDKNDQPTEFYKSVYHIS